MERELIENKSSTQIKQPSQLPNDAERSQDAVQTVESVMQQLQQLSYKIESNAQYPLGFMKDYVTLYVQNHNRSEQFFNLMCEHNILAKLFSGISRPIYILEIFNLLLANTQQTSQLVYIFSHPLFHNYLLINFQNIYNVSNNQQTNYNSNSTTHECIQYYIQLLKTIIMKLQSSSNQHTLLKLFCNSKYSSFPLLTNCIILAIKRNIKEELVRVTAQHCILQLIEIIARKKIGEYYLSNIHMLVFFYEIIHQTIIEETTQSNGQDTTIKYIIDLLKAIALSESQEIKQKSYLLFFTIFNNLLVFKFMKNPAPGLHLLFKLSNCFSQIQQLQQIPQKYLSPIYFIFAKHLFNKYLNNVSLSSIILLSQAISSLSELKEVNILKLIKNHYEKSPLQGEDIEKSKTSYQQKSLNNSQKSSINLKSSFSQRASIFEKQSLNSSRSSYKSNKPINAVILPPNYENMLKQIQKYMLDNEQFFELKQNYYKKISNNNGGWFSGINALFKKINVFDVQTSEYIRKVAHIGSIKYQMQRPIKFLEQVFSPTAIYIYQFLKLKNKQKYYFGQKTQDTQKIQISFNQNRDQFLIQKEFFKVILSMSQLCICQIQSIEYFQQKKSMFSSLQKKFNKSLSHLGEVYFILHFRQYFQHSLSQFICTSSHLNYRTQNLTFNIIKLIYKITYFLHPSLTELHRTKIQAQILKLQKELYSIIKQKGFQPFWQYLQSQKQKKLTQQLQKNNMQNSMIKFQNKESMDNISPLKKKKSSEKKRKSIFMSFKSDSPDKSASKSLISSLKTDQTLKIVQCKMMHLQLLRYLMRTSGSLIISSSKLLAQKQPLNVIFSTTFVKRYSLLYSSNGKINSTIYQCQKIKFNSQQGYECYLRVRTNFDECVIILQLFYQNKLILKCNIKQFNLSEAYQKKDEYQELTSELKMDKKSNEINSKGEYLVKIQPTSNTLGFIDRQHAQNFINRINQIKFEYREIKDISILQYLNKQDQNQYFNQSNK